MENLRLAIITMSVGAFPKRREGHEDELVPEMLKYMQSLRGRRKEFEMLLLGLQVRSDWRFRDGRRWWEVVDREVLIAKRYLGNKNGLKPIPV